MQQNKYLRQLRKRHYVTQTDIAHLLGGTERSIISKIENGTRPISSNITITYGLLFNKSMLEKIGCQELQRMKNQLKERLTSLIVNLEELPSHPEIKARIEFFDKILNDLVTDEERCQ